MDELGQRVGAALQAAGIMLATAESCTGGLIAQRVTSVPGSSAWFERGFVTYSNAAKVEMLGVDESLLQLYGAVSEPVVLAMTAGALASSRAGAAVAVSGVAGPGGGTAAKPVGTVCIAWQLPGRAGRARSVHLPGDREGIRWAASDEALRGLLDLLSA